MDCHGSVPSGPPTMDSLHRFDPVAPSDTYLLQIDASKATGSDGIPGSILKECADVLAYSLSVLLCASLRTGVVPSAFKLASVVPLYKSGDSSRPNNYRPVSLLPIISKLLEKIVQRQLVRHLRTNQCLPTTQFAYRQHHSREIYRSAEDALCLLTDSLFAAKDGGNVTGLCALDMSKAFDKVRHTQLIVDLFDVGVCGSALTWFASYLTAREQMVCIGPTTSQATPCTCGVPQGSVLGPVLFSIYTRDVPSVLHPGPSIQFADDIALYSSQSSVGAVSATLTTAVTNLAVWLQARGLVPNSTKSRAVTFLPLRQVDNPLVTVQCRGVAVPTASTTTYLGVVLGSKLSWDAQVDRIVSKTTRTIGALW